MTAQPQLIAVSFVGNPLQHTCKMDHIILEASENKLHPNMYREDHLLLGWSWKPLIQSTREQWEPPHDETQSYMALFRTTCIHDHSFPCHPSTTTPAPLTNFIPDHPHSTSHLYVPSMSCPSLCFYTLHPITGQFLLM